MRITLLIVVLVFSFSTSADAGWLGDKLKQAAEDIGDRLIDDASDSAYDTTKQEAKEAIKPEESKTGSEASGRYNSQEDAEMRRQAEEYASDPGKYHMNQPSWSGGSTDERKPRKKRKMGPPRTDLHLSAEMIMSDPENMPEPIKGNIYIDGARTRTEFKYQDNNSVGMILTGIEPDDKVYVLMHSEKSYMESSVKEQDDDSFWVDSSKPCAGFRKAEDLGRTKLNGRSVVKWRCSDPEDPQDAEESMSVMTFWFDDKLKMPVRMEDENRKGYWELVNIREGKPPADLFEVPNDYKMFSINIPMGRINQ